MSRDSRRNIHVALALMALIAGVGCSSLPTRPAAQAPPTAAGPDTTSADLGAKSSPISIRPATTTRTINGTLGGLVSAGNFTVVIPPLAVSGTVTVTVSQPDVSKPYVNLEISPPSANGFLVPVTLIADAAPMSTKTLAAAYVSWFNPSTGKWQPMPSKVDLASRTVSCPLQHFSTYGVESGGKAGW